MSGVALFQLAGKMLGHHFSGFSGNREMSGNSAKVRERLRKRPKVREKSGNLCSQCNLIVAAQQTVVW